MFTTGENEKQSVVVEELRAEKETAVAVPLPELLCAHTEVSIVSMVSRLKVW